jgi:hypothetical protein
MRFFILIGCLVGLMFVPGPQGWATEVRVGVETGAVWFSRNDARIPGDSGTKTDLTSLTGHGPDPVVRLTTEVAFTPRHLVRLTLAPVEVEGTGTLSRETVFKDGLFSPGIPTKATYRFNTYRLTYRWNFHTSDRWQWGVGAALLVRDAEIALEQAGEQQARDDLGVVPLLHVYGAYRLDDAWSLIVDVEGAGASPGRAIDAAFKLRYASERGWYAALGYRTIEGGADNDDVYTFAWLHAAVAEVGYRF